jgi:hypothetical protein
MAGTPEKVLSPIPLLAKGWAHLAGHGIKIAAPLAGLQQTLMSSVWTMFDQEGIEIVRSAFQQGDIQ